MSDSVRPHRRQPTRLPHLWDSPGKNTGVGCHFLLQCMNVKRESEVSQSCRTLSDPMDCSLPGSSVHGIFQGRVLEWGAIAFADPFLLGIKFQTNQKTWIKKKISKALRLSKTERWKSVKESIVTFSTQHFPSSGTSQMMTDTPLFK